MVISKTWFRKATLFSTYMPKMYCLELLLDIKAKFITFSMALSLLNRLLLSDVSQLVISLLMAVKRLDWRESVAMLCSRDFLAKISILLKLVPLLVLTSPLLKAK